MPLKSVAKRDAHSCEALRAERMALPLPGTGLDAQACQGEWQVTHLAAVGRAAMPQALQRTGRR